MVSKAAKIRLGVFLTIGAILIIIFAAIVAGSRLVEKKDIYYIEFEDYSVSGLQVGSSVNYRGIKIGRVEDIKINPKDVTKIIVSISVNRGTPIKEDTEAVLLLSGITGLKSVEIRGGTNEAKLLKPKSYIKPGTTMLEDISERAKSIVDKIDMIAANLNLITGEENRQNISKILEQTSLILKDTHENLATTMQSISRIANNTADLTEELSRDLSAVTDNLTKNLDAITNSATSNIQSVSETSQTSLISVTSNVNKQLEELTSQLEYSLARLTEDGSALIREANLKVTTVGEHSDQMILETTREILTISNNINKTLDQVNAILYTPGVDSLMTNLGTLCGELSRTNINEMVSELSTTIHKTGNLVANLNRVVTRGQGDLLEILSTLTETSENLNEFSRQIADTPAILLRGN
ncbi:MAG TPA: MlaD family protein [Candidatus Cloacimonas sp.]|nr:MlaD family protein [Candidatus Cloacimonas sp.]HNZ33153.1 MlaD family protein [Candidatus Cloacimonas sp.]HOQ78309.1 MlaD family protein [Candidatus Cloacimonas sp.]HOU26163.1 MlaD family protein [Candidatus Cloacimonas sp.]HPK60140.1 MlaD family protein [Candidatus Cloacimonas sp.]